MMSKNIQKGAYLFSILASVAVAFLGLTLVAPSVASAQYDEGYWDGYYYDDYGYGDTNYGYGGYSDPYDGYYEQPDWSDYGYSYGGYGGYGGYDDCYNCGYNDQYAYGGYYDDCYYGCYDDYYYGNDDCYYYNDCYYDTCGSSCSSNDNRYDTIIDIYNNNNNENNNVNTNTNINYSFNDNDDDEDDEDEDDVDFDVVCIPSDDEVDEGDRVTFRARVSGVSASRVDFDWSGDVDGDDQEVTERFNREGTYRAKVRAEYRGEVETDTCTIEVEDDRNDRDRDRSNVTLVSTPPTGTPASLNSVYLSQVPYTGASDNMKLIGFITMLALSSLAGAYYVVTRKARSDRKSFIERFKQDNIASKA